MSRYASWVSDEPGNSETYEDDSTAPKACTGKR